MSTPQEPPDIQERIRRQLARAERLNGRVASDHYASLLQDMLDQEHRAAVASNAPADDRIATIDSIFHEFFEWLRHQLNQIEGN